MARNTHENNLKGFLKQLVVIFLLVVAVLATILPAATRIKAQEPLSGEGPVPTLNYTFAKLAGESRVLRHPRDKVSYFFGLPANVLPIEGTVLTLDLDYQVLSRQNDFAPAKLEVWLNDERLQTLVFQNAAVTQVQIPIPASLFRKYEDSLLNEIALLFSSDVVCEEGRFNTLTVQNSSAIQIRYQRVPLKADLSLFPKPIYQENALTSSTARIILPGDPFETHAQAAAMIAAYLGAASDGETTITPTVGVNLPALQAIKNDHVIIIGTPEDQPILKQLTLPVTIQQRQHKLSASAPSQIAAGQTISYTIAVTNTAPTARNIILVDQLPLSLKTVSCSDKCQAQPDGKILWNLGSLAAGESRTVTGSLIYNKIVTTRTTVTKNIVDHTVTLLDDNTPVNVKTINARLAGATGPTTESSTLDTPFFFARGGLGLPETDGLLIEILSPANPEKVVVIVTGLNSEAILKAARALSTRNLVPGIVRGDYALVQQFQPIFQPPQSELSKTTLAALGYDHEVIKNIKTSTLVYRFEIPWGVTPDSNTYFMLHFAHSTALSRINAVASITLNDLPVGSIDLTAPITSNPVFAPASPPTNPQQTPQPTATVTTTPTVTTPFAASVIGSKTGWLYMQLPETALLNGENTLEITLATSEDDVCSFLEEGSWFTAFNDSFIQTSYRDGSTAVSLSNYPQPFNGRAGIIHTTFILPNTPTQQDFQMLFNLVGELGRTAAGTTFWPGLFFGMPSSPEGMKNNHLIAIGLPTNNSLIAQVAEILPQPFIPGTNQIEQVVNNVIYRLPPQLDIGLVQEIASPWNEDRALLVATGTTQTGVTWAVRALSDPNLNWQLGSNLAVVNGKKIQAIDTRELFAYEIRDAIAGVVPELTPQATIIPPTPTPTLTPTPTSTPAPVVALLPTLSPQELAALNQIETHPSWQIPALVMTGIVSLLILALILIKSRR